jgi:TPR repeat protein
LRSDLKSFDYLLNEEDERKGGAWKYVALIILLAVALGFGYVRWRSQTQGWFKASKPTAGDQTADDSNANSATPSPAPAAAQDVARNQPPAQPSSQPAAASQPVADTGKGATPAAGNAPAATSPPASTDSPAPSATPTPATKPAAKSDADDADSAPAAKADAPETAPASKQPVPARAAKPTPTIPKPDMSNVVAEATQYIYGKGVTQDCDRGLRLLKPAANQSDPRAMIQMGALYSAGLCAPRDLPTAYRWFALALRKEPDNASVGSDLQKLWSEMTPPERQLAIRLTH